jgi:hypothetical protein
MMTALVIYVVDVYCIDCATTVIFYYAMHVCVDVPCVYSRACIDHIIAQISALFTGYSLCSFRP